MEENFNLKNKTFDKKLSKAEKIDWFRLANIPSIGPITFKQLIAKFGNAKTALEELPEFSKKVGRIKSLKIMSSEQAETYLERCQKRNVHVIASCEDEYPKNLKAIHDYPPILHVLGNKELLYKNFIAIVGSRNASIQGKAFASKISKELIENGFYIASGLARGIDAAAHLVDSSKTLAVLGCGVDVVYPLENKALYEQIIQNGVVVSEELLGKQPRPEAFSYRNRIIAALSKCVVVVEAAVKSGSLITANYALNQGKDVFAVPGHPLDIRASGANYLLKNGAYLLERTQDILNHLTNNYKTQSLFNEPENMINEENIEQIKFELLNQLSSAPITINEIIRSSNHSTAAIQSALAELELAENIVIECNTVLKNVK